tara:strand:- start:46 stop:330 length:285 start_codon:yes stop_codon:yes gene_type:complete
MTEQTITITKPLLNKCLTKGVGISNETYRCLTGDVSPTKGWRKRILGSTILLSDYEAALEGKTKPKMDLKTEVMKLREDVETLKGMVHDLQMRI